MAEEDKLKGKARTVGAAVKKNEKFFYDKKGVKKLAVTAEELKKSGKTLTQWANDWKKPGSSTAVSKSLRPKKRPTSGGSVSAVTAKETAEVKKRNAEIKLQIKARKDTGPNAARKKPMAKKKVEPITFKMWQGMSRAERKSNGLPVSEIGGQMGFNRFKTGITGKEYDSKGRVVGGDSSKKKDTRSPDPLRLAGRGGIR